MEGLSENLEASADLERRDVEVVVEVALFVAARLLGEVEQLRVHGRHVGLEPLALLLLALLLADRDVDERVHELRVQLEAHLLHQHLEVPATRKESNRNIISIL